MKPSSRTKQWLRNQVQDPWVQKAHKEGFRSRAAYKLMQIDQRYHLLSPEVGVIDLGSAPGGWSQYLTRKQNLRWIWACDLLPMEPIKGVTFCQGDFNSEALQQELFLWLHGERASLVLSDVAPNLSGHPLQDQFRMEAILQSMLDFCKKFLKKGGIFVAKAFQGASYITIRQAILEQFHELKSYKPPTSRPQSREIYLIAKGQKS